MLEINPLDARGLRIFSDRVLADYSTANVYPQIQMTKTTIAKTAKETVKPDDPNGLHLMTDTPPA